MQIVDLIQQHRFTILLGKNGAGKSTLLRSLNGRNDLNTRYITPERGGVLKYEPNIDTNIANNPNWLDDSRRQNRLENFRQQSAAQFRNLEILYLRELEKNQEKRLNLNLTFDSVLEELNKYLPAVRLVRSDRGFSIKSNDDVPIDEGQTSSGESEFIAQAIELLVYSRSNAPDKILLLDEPDVHLHPDLQARFVAFIESTANEYGLRVVIATHSTAIISGFSEQADLQIVPVSRRQQVEFDAFVRSRVSDELLPIFGAHPLSSVFNKSPIVLVEGDDDKRVLEQVVRSSDGRVKRNPCVVGTVTEMARWEAWLNQFLPVIYDEPTAYSLRDLDDSPVCDIEDLGCVRRARLNCYAMENLLLTDEALNASGTNAEGLLRDLLRWKESYPNHPNSEDIDELIQNFAGRRTLKIKRARNIILALLGVTKPWEVYLGQLLAQDAWANGVEEHSLASYVGEKARECIFNLPVVAQEGQEGAQAIAQPA